MSTELFDLAADLARAQVHDDGIVTVRLAPHVAKHIHWVLTQHGLNLTGEMELPYPADRMAKLRAEQQLNGVALAVFTDKVRRLK